MNANANPTHISDSLSRGQRWLRALAGEPVRSGPVWFADAPLGDESARFIAVVPDSDNRFPRARENVVGLEQGWRLARTVRDVVEADADAPRRRPIVAIVDVKSQAYGYREEMLGIHLACAAAIDAYASARLAGHPIVALIVGPAMSGAFLAHGYQANRILALDAPGTTVHAMGKEAAARVTRRCVEALDALAETITPMSYSLTGFAKLGLLDQLIERVDADAPTEEQIARVRGIVTEAAASARSGPVDLSRRLESDSARATRAASIEVRQRMALQWDAV
jgi:malonate decarboxylase gamma subunit